MLKTEYLLKYIQLVSREAKIPAQVGLTLNLRCFSPGYATRGSARSTEIMSQKSH